MQRINALLTKEHLDALAGYLFPASIWKGREEAFLNQDGLVGYVLRQILANFQQRPNYPFLSHVKLAIT